MTLIIDKLTVRLPTGFSEPMTPKYALMATKRLLIGNNVPRDSFRFDSNRKSNFQNGLYRKKEPEMQFEFIFIGFSVCRITQCLDIGHFRKINTLGSTEPAGISGMIFLSVSVKLLKI